MGETIAIFLFWSRKKLVFKCAVHYIVSKKAKTHLWLLAKRQFAIFIPHLHVSGHALNLVSPFHRVRQQVLRQGGDVPQSPNLVRENYMSNSIGFNGGSGHQILSMTRPYAERFRRAFPGYQTAFGRTIGDIDGWSRRALANPLSAQRDILCRQAGNLRLSNGQIPLGTNHIWMSSPYGGIGNSRTRLGQIHTEATNLGRPYLRRVYRATGLRELSRIDIQRLYIHGLSTGAPVEVATGIPTPGANHSIQRLFHSATAQRGLSNDSVLERIASGRVPTRRPERGGVPAETWIGGLCNGISSVRAETWRLSLDRFSLLGEAPESFALW